ncbi:MAG: hypothetical protein ABI167_09315 [Nitrosospira sp.]
MNWPGESDRFLLLDPDASTGSILCHRYLVKYLARLTGKVPASEPQTGPIDHPTC